tara:strand:+ start:186678 stop:187154 length:477 start_codon:yes stop_codon:yes gene_type:complete
MIIRKIQPQDNAALEQIIKTSLVEFGMPTVGTAYEDKETTMMYEAYQNEREVYYVIEVDGAILGGGGIKPLQNTNEDVCELQKMYFNPSIRGKGYGKMLIRKCLQASRDLGFKKCYLESAANLKAAIHLYESHDFKHLKGPLGDTGHYSCSVWMLKHL